MIDHRSLIDKIGVYRITNLINNNSYVGSSSSSLYKRFSLHREQLRKNKHYNEHLQRAWNKYGEENFEFVVIEFCDNKDDCLDRETFYINELLCYIPDLGYNKRRIAESNLGLKLSEEQLDRRKGFGKGRKTSDETKLKQSMSAKGRKFKEESKEKLRNLPANNRNVLMLSLDGKIVKQFKNLTETAIFLGNKGLVTLIGKIIKGKLKTCRGYTFRYKDDYNYKEFIPIVRGCTKEIDKFDMSGNFIKGYLSLLEAEKDIGIIGSNSNISACCNGKKKSAYGYKWKYKN